MSSLSCITLMFFVLLILLGALVHMLVVSVVSVTLSFSRLAHRQKQSLEIEVTTIEHAPVKVFRSN